MSPEQFHDALNYLDDDLVEQTDDLRQGRRVLRTRPTVRQILPWVASAACLALVLGFGPELVPRMETGFSAVVNEGDRLDGQNGSPEESAQQSWYGTSDSVVQNTESWVRVSNGAISLAIPLDWEYELATADDGGYSILVRPAGAEGAVRVGYVPGFAVCGTGLSTAETTIAGMDASVGTYDDDPVWTYIVFTGAGRDYVALNEGADAWWSTDGDTVMKILETIEFEA